MSGRGSMVLSDGMQDPTEIPATPIERPNSVPAAPVQVDAGQALKAMFLGGTPEQKLLVVETAIFEIMFGGQSFMIGTRKLTRADLKNLNALRDSLRAEVAAANGNSVVVAISRGR